MTSSTSNDKKSIWKQALWRKSLELIRKEEEEEEIERSLGFFDLLMIGIGGTVGSGVFSTAGLIASSYAGPAAIFSWIIAGTGCIFSGASFMELSTIIPSSGSTYAYSYHALGEIAAMISGFLLTLEYGVASAGGARSWSDKFTSLMSEFGYHGASWMKNEYIDVYAALLLFICVLIVLCGISTGKRFINTITVAKITVVLFIIVVGLGHFRQDNLQPFIPPSQTNEFGEVIFGLPGIMLGASASFYGYIGYDEVCCLAGEAKNPGREIPRAVIGTVIGASFLSTMATLALVGMQHYTDIDSAAAYGKAFESIGLNVVKRIVETGEVFTMPVGVLIGFLAQPRLQYAMAKDGLLPAIFAKVDQHGNIFWGTLISGIVLIITSLTVQFAVLWDFISLGILLAFNLTNSSLIIVRCRKKRPVLAPVLLAGYFFASFLAACVWQKGVVAHHIEVVDSMGAHVRQLNVVLASILSAVSVCLMFSLFWFCPQVYEAAEGFRAPLVPFTPCLAIFFNWFLFAQMHWFAMLMILSWVLLAIFVYFVYGASHSISARRAGATGIQYEMVKR